jgi:hypothetical protein
MVAPVTALIVFLICLIILYGGFTVAAAWATYRCVRDRDKLFSIVFGILMAAILYCDQFFLRAWLQ